MSQSSKRQLLSFELEKNSHTLPRSCVSNEKVPFFLNINTNHRFRFCHRAWVSVLPLEIKGARRTPAMAPSSGYVSLLSWCGTFGYLPRPTWWESRVPMPVKNIAVIMFSTPQSAASRTVKLPSPPPSLMTAFVLLRTCA